MKNGNSSPFGARRCAACPNLSGGVAACEVPPWGDPDVVFVGEAPGRFEELERRPFVGPSGKLLRQLVEKHGDGLRVAYVNAVSCRPPNNKISTALVEACRDLFELRLRVLGERPLYVALGATAAKALGLRGKMGDLVDVVHITPHGEVYVAYHPAYVLRRGTASTYEESIRRALEYARTRRREVLVNERVLAAPFAEGEPSPRVAPNELCVVDVETHGANPFDPADSDLSLVALLRPSDGQAVVSRPTPGALKVVGELVARGVTVWHNARFDLRYLVGKGVISWEQVDWRRFHDTMLLYYVLHEDGVEHGGGKKGEKGSHGLKPLSGRYLGVPHAGDGLFGPYSRELAAYAARDVWATWELFQQAWSQMDAHDRRLYDHLRRATVLVAQMEETGVLVDWDALDELRQELEAARKDAVQVMRALVGDMAFNPRSHPQVRRALYEEWGLPVVKRTDAGNPSTDLEAVEALLELEGVDRQARRFLEELVRYRRADKVVTTYIEGWRKRAWRDGRLHPSFHLTGTVTGRLSSSNPNLQNVTKHSELGKLLRRAVIAPPGHVIVEVDGSQMELRVFAWLARDDAYAEPLRRGEDIHAATARAIYGERFDLADEERKRLRTHAKRVSFGVLYGMGAEALAKQIGTTVEEAAEILESYYRAHPAVLAYRERRMEELLRNGYVLTPLTGRKRRVPFIPDRRTREWEELQKHIWNAEVQGLASDLTLMVAYRLNERWYPRGVRPFAFIHDSIAAYVPQELAEEYALDAEEEFARLGLELLGDYVPLVGEAEWGYNWAEMKPVREG